MSNKDRQELQQLFEKEIFLDDFIVAKVQNAMGQYILVGGFVSGLMLRQSVLNSQGQAATIRPEDVTGYHIMTWPKIDDGKGGHVMMMVASKDVMGAYRLPVVDILSGNGNIFEFKRLFGEPETSKLVDSSGKVITQ